MSVESTIQSLLEEARKMKQVAESKETVSEETVAEEVAENSIDEAASPHNDLSGRMGTSTPGYNRTPAGIAREKARKTAFLKGQMHFTKSTGGVAGPKGKLPEEVESVAEESLAEGDTVDLSEDIAALFNGEDGLTEDFRNKAATIFEAAVTSRVKQEAERIETALVEQFEEILASKIEESVEGLVEKVDGYLNLMVEQWMKDNEIALETGMKSDILESFVSGMKSLFEDHYIDVPQEKYDLIGDMEQKIEELSLMLDESVANTITLKRVVEDYKKAEIINSNKEGLTDIDADKFASLAEEIAFEDEESFSSKIQVIRENYFSKASVKGSETSPAVFLSEEAVEEEKTVSGDMLRYVNVIKTLTK